MKANYNSNGSISIQTDSGQMAKLEILEEFDIERNHYIIAAPEDSNEAYAYKTIDKNGFREFQAIGPGKEFDRILQEYDRRNIN